MNLDSDHVLFWMDAIRNSSNKERTLESFWKGQIRSKIWLIENLKPFIRKPVKIDIHGGWMGVLASLLFQSDIPISKIRSIDIDPECEPIANTVNKLEEIEGRFQAITANMLDIETDANIVINTSCEHLTQNEYEIWLSKISEKSIIVLQSNNYDILEHIRIAKDLEEFKEQSGIDQLCAIEKSFPLYNRFMIIGKKV